MFEHRERGSFSRMFLIALVTSLGVGVITFLLTYGYAVRNRPAPTPQTQQQIQAPQTTQAPKAREIAADITVGKPAAQTVAKNATAGVVGITVERVAAGKLFDGNNVQVGVGSGVIVSSDGYILTNNHVAGGKSKSIVVSLADGRNVNGTVVWSDAVMDLAVVKVNEKGLPTLTLGDASVLQVGEPAIAIGNPLGLEFQRTVTSGIVSALNRTIQIETEQGTNYMEDLIQTDASINPGNSGGPLFNSRGEVVGINTIKVTSAEAIGFAIPINVAKPILSRLINTGTFTEAYLGLFAYDKAVIPYVDSDAKIDNGVYVAHIDDGGPAYKAGIRIGCIIKQVDGKDINTMMQLREIIYSKAPGDTINVMHLMHETNEWVTVPIKLAAKEKDGLVTR